MSMSEMDKGEPESKEDKIEEVIELNHHGHNLTVSLQLPLASDSNNHANMESKNCHDASENKNEKNFSGGHGQDKKRKAYLMGSNIQTDSVYQSKVPWHHGPSLATCYNNDRDHPIGASVCTINKMQEHKDSPDFSDVTAKLEIYKKAASRLPMIASEFGNLQFLEMLLDHGANINIQNEMKLNSLLIALKCGHVDCAKLLLSRGAHLDLPTAVKLTLENKQSAALQFLASQYKIDVDKDNLLHLAVKMGMEDIVSILINMGADVNKGDSYGITPLQVALRSHHGKSLIKCLIQNGACVNGNWHLVPLHFSMLLSVEITKLLLDSGADVNGREIFNKNTALIAACSNGLDIEIVKLLLARGAQINLQNKIGQTALHLATRQANVDLVQLLVKSGADLEIQTHDNKTAYLLAAIEGDIKIIEALQKLGANTSAVDSSGCNALMLAIKFVRLKSIETSTILYLCGNGSQINHQCNNGYTALMLAAEEWVWELLEPLLDLGADASITASDGLGRNFTALSILLKNYSGFSFYGVDLLIRRGAVNSLPNWCNDVLHKMIARDRRHMVQLLLTNGMAPTMASLQLHKCMPISFYSMPVLKFTELSPLIVALACSKICVAQYLVRNWALCPCDLSFVSLKKLRDFLVAFHKSESVEIVDKLLCQPASLLQLSFITVSHALGGVPGREDRINSLPLPQIIKKKLMFREDVLPTCLTKDFSKS